MLNRLKEAFSCDLRTLALFRICIAGLILADLVNRARDLTAHYTDAGILPRADLLAIHPTRMSLHLISGSAAGQSVLFLLAGLAAVALLVGYRTRWMAVISWILLISLQLRNPMVSQGGDMLLRLLLFWGLFLPLGARFSVDAALDKEDPPTSNSYFSFATVGLLLQAMSVYFFTALLKNSSVWIPDGTAVEYAMRLDHITTSAGVWLRGFPLIGHGLTYFVWVLELVAPLLMFLPLVFPWLRLLGLFLLFCMHAAFFVFLNIGLFPFVSITSLIAFLPRHVWDWLGARIRTPERLGLRIYYDVDCGFCLKTCRLLRVFLLHREVPILPAQDYPDIHATMKRYNSWVVVDHTRAQHVRFEALALLFRRSPLWWPLGALMTTGAARGPGDRFYEWVARNRPQLSRITATVLPYRSNATQLTIGAEAIVALFVILMLWTNIASVLNPPAKLPGWVASIRDSLRLNQKWDMFAPAPMKREGWYVVRGKATTGETVDVLKGTVGEPSWQRPHRLASQYSSNYRWRKVLTELPRESKQAYRPSYANYLCRSWNKTKPNGLTLAELEIFLNSERVVLNDDPRPVERILLHHQACGAAQRPASRTPLPQPDEMVQPY